MRHVRETFVALFICELRFWFWSFGHGASLAVVIRQRVGWVERSETHQHGVWGRDGFRVAQLILRLRA
jgi:hypothetical protein